MGVKNKHSSQLEPQPRRSVLRETNGSRWHVYKCRGSQLLSHVVSDGATLATFDEIREENLAQIALAEGSELDEEEFSHE